MKLFQFAVIAAVAGLLLSVAPAQAEDAKAPAAAASTAKTTKARGTGVKLTAENVNTLCGKSKSADARTKCMDRMTPRIGKEMTKRTQSRLAKISKGTTKKSGT